MLTLIGRYTWTDCNLGGKVQNEEMCFSYGSTGYNKVGAEAVARFFLIELCQQQFSLMVTQGQKEDPGLLTLLSLWKAATRVSLKDHFPGDAIALLFTGDTNVFLRMEYEHSLTFVCKAPHRAANGYKGGDKLRDACQSLYQALERKVFCITFNPRRPHCNSLLSNTIY